MLNVQAMKKHSETKSISKTNLKAKIILPLKSVI